MTDLSRSPTDRRSVDGRRYDAALHLLDRQIVDPDDRPVANVDDLELSENEEGALVVTALLTGPGALGPRLGGRIGTWTVAIWRRLHFDAHPVPGRIDAALITDIDSAIHTAARIGDLHINGLEQWVRDNVIRRIPGATHEPE
jgi:hypothetical protein